MLKYVENQVVLSQLLPFQAASCIVSSFKDCQEVLMGLIMPIILSVGLDEVLLWY